MSAGLPQGGSATAEPLNDHPEPEPGLLGDWRVCVCVVSGWVHFPGRRGASVSRGAWRSPGAMVAAASAVLQEVEPVRFV